MNTYHACFFVSKNAEYRAFLNFIKSSGLDLQAKVSISFSLKEAALADIIFVDEKTANQQCAVLMNIKKENRNFLPVLLLNSEKANMGEKLPACIDDVILSPFSQTEWKRRLGTYLNLRKKEKDIFSREESQFKALFTESHSIMLLVDPETGKIEDANRAACRFYGYTYSEMINMKIQQINMPKEEQVSRELANEDSDKKNYFVFEHRLADGSIRTVEVNSGKVNHKGKHLIYSIIQDITDTKKMEKLLLESEENYRKFIENSPDIVAFIDKNGIVRFINQRIREYGNYVPEDIIGKPFTRFIPPEDHQKARDAVRKIFDNIQAAPVFSSSLLLKDGRKIPIITRSILLKYNGKMVNMTIIRDISFVKETEKKLKISEETFENIFNNSSVAIYIQDKEGTFLDINKAALKQYALTDKAELIGKKPEFVAAEGKNDMAEIKKYLSLAFNGTSQQFEFWAKRKDGTVFPKLVIIEKGIYFGQPVIFNFSFDISEQKKTEEALRESEAKYHSIFKTSSDAISISEFNSGKYIETNDIFKKTLGYTKEELVGKTSLGLKIWVDTAERKKMINALKKETFIKDMESRFRDKKGDIITGLLSAQLISLHGNDYVVGEIRDITLIKQAEEALRESRQLFETLAKISPTGIFRTDAKGKTTYVNPQWSEITGVSFERSTKKGWADILPPNEKEELLARWNMNMASKTFSKEKLRIVRSDGSVRWILGHAVPEIINDKFTGYVGTITDITDLVKAELSLRESENKYRSLAEVSIDIILTYDPWGRITYVNPVVKTIFGYSPEELVGRKFSQYIAPEFVKKTLSSFYKGEQGNAIPLYEIEIIHKNGMKIPVEINPTSIYDAEGNIKGGLSIIRDIRVRKKAGKALKESEEKYKEQSRLFRLMSDNIPDLVWAKDPEGRFIFTNKAICVKLLIAKDTDEPIGKRDPYFGDRQRRLYPDRDNWYTFDELCSESDALVYKTQKPVRSNEFGYVQGKFLYFDVYKAPIFDENNQIIGTVGHGRDVTKEKEAEKALLLRDKALNATASAIIITDANGKIEWVNMAFTKLSGYSEKEAVGKSTTDLVGTGNQDEAFYDNLHNILKSGRVWTGEFIDKRKDGTLYEVGEVITPVTDKNGKVEHLIGIMNDISERKRAERELRAAKEAAEESSRLKSAFLANMNHEIRTPMNAIMGFSELMLDATPKEKINYAQIVNKSAGQLLNLIDNIIFLSRLQSEKLPVKKTTFYPVDLINEIFLMFDLPEMKKNLQLQSRLPEKAGTISMHADAYKIRQVMTNFTSNAIKYTKKGFVKLGFEMHDNSILFFVEDSGMGIPENEQQHVLEAFYRGSMAVSAAIRGTGMGLNIAKELVELMGSTIGVSSQPGKGSRFYFSLPYEPPKAALTVKTQHKEESEKWENINILIAEDDETNFLYLDVLLKEKVSRIDRACNGLEAVEMTRQTTYDLVLMDLKMPVMSGAEATMKIKKRYPHLPVIATTAYATMEEKERAMDAGCDDYMGKPIKKADIMALISRYVS